MNTPQQQEAAYMAGRIVAIGERIELQKWNCDNATAFLEASLRRLAELQNEQTELIQQLKEITK